MSSLLIHNIGMLATPEGSEARRGADQGSLRVLEQAWIYTENGEIISWGTGNPPITFGAKLDAGGRLVTPGLVDAHTHLIFGGWRQNELAMKLRNVPYLDILAAGGGIHSTVKATRAATEEELAAKASAAMDEMLCFGTTSCEAKSGYGLCKKEELKQLKVIKRLNKEHPMDLAATFMGAHALPPEFKESRAGYLKLLCEDMIPAVAKQKLAKFCDVFCETGVFTAEESRQILQAGLDNGLIPKIHADEIDPIGGSQLAGEIGAISAEHLIVCPDDGIESLARGGTIACLLPATSFYLNSTYAPARKMIEAGVPVALASDYNPGSCPCLNLQLVMNIACLKYRLTPEEVLTGVTLNAAAAMGMADRIGSVDRTKQADLVIWEAPDLNYLCYRLGSNLAHTVIKKGEIVHGKAH
ncbi:MAG: imidazolonepropionase [Oscillospiraceae bacterium]|nr:imidazolonepropionase [Oscillospiraceae bacterium]